jgi:hypothetical protein
VPPSIPHRRRSACGGVVSPPGSGGDAARFRGRSRLARVGDRETAERRRGGRGGPCLSPAAGAAGESCRGIILAARVAQPPARPVDGSRVLPGYHGWKGTASRPSATWCGSCENRRWLDSSVRGPGSRSNMDACATVALRGLSCREDSHESMRPRCGCRGVRRRAVGRAGPRRN